MARGVTGAVVAWAESRSIPVTETGCWLWLGAEKGNGYGHLTRKRKNVTAHRASYELAYGPVAAGMDVCHRCDTRLCINPEHLFVGTRTDNMRDAKAKGRTAQGSTHGDRMCGEKAAGVKLRVEQVETIRKVAANGLSVADIAKLTQVSTDNIRRIVRHDTWKDTTKCAA